MITLHMEYMSRRKLIIDGPTTVPCCIHLYFTITWCNACTQTFDDAKLLINSQDAQISKLTLNLKFSVKLK